MMMTMIIIVIINEETTAKLVYYDGFLQITAVTVQYTYF